MISRRRPFRVAALLTFVVGLPIATAAGPDAAGVAGVWEFEIQVDGRTLRPTVEFEAGPGGLLKGICRPEPIARAEARGTPVADARWDGERLGFKVSTEVQGRRFDLTVEGKVTGDRFEGEVTYESDAESGSRPATARRKPVASANASKAAGAPRILTFKEGFDGYQGTDDVELWGVAPTKPLGDQGTMTSDADNGGGESHVLLKFGKIFEGDPGATAGRAIPRNARIVRAKLVVIAFDPGNTVYLHPMLVPWDESATWNSMARGVTADDTEAARRWDGFTFGQINMDKQSVEFDVTATVQGWADGRANHGWVFLNSGGNGWDFYSSEWQEADLRPVLQVEWAPRGPAGGLTR